MSKLFNVSLDYLLNEENTQKKVISHSFNIRMSCLKRGDLYGDITYC